MRKYVIGSCIAAILLGITTACTKQEDMVRVNTDIVEALRTWSVYEDLEDAFPEKVIEMVNTIDPSFNTKPYNAKEKPHIISSHNLIYSLRNVEDQVSHKAYLNLYKNFEKRYHSVFQAKKSPITMMDKLEDELDGFRTVIPNSSEDLYFHGQICTIIDEIKWYREKYEKGEQEDESWRKEEISIRLAMLAVIAELVNEHPDFLQFNGGSDFQRYVSDFVSGLEMKEVLQTETPAVNEVLEQTATTSEEEKNAALNRAMAIVNEKIEGIASIVAYDGDLDTNGQTYYAFYCTRDDQSGDFRLFVNSGDFKVYKDNHGFDTEWVPE
ncbi:MAG: hypothetical protein K6T88_13605 [Bacillus sp. (in: Bacteria)]|nr:hypothetical protein [Bacillus sp. (in: firmicutes)]